VNTAGSSHERGWTAKLRSWAQGLRNREDQLFLVLTLLVGIITGLVVVAFIILTERLGSRLYPIGSAWWRPLVVPVTGSLVTGWLLVKYFPEARGSGIPQTKAALALKGGRISLRTVVGRFFCSSASLASGIALGREGPSVQIGAGIASVLGQRLGLGKKRLTELLPVGAAAAVAAAFNTPIAAVLFALEEVVGNLHAPVIGSVVIGSATSWAILHLYLGDEAIFHVPAFELRSPLELFVYAGLGVVGGLYSVVFVKMVLWLRARFLRLPAATRWAQPVVGGLTVGMLGIFLPQVLGVGYDYVDQVLNGDILIRVVLLLIPLKLIATAMCYSSGNTGGIFGPSLFFGAMIGGAAGHFAQQLFPDFSAGAGAYALVGMGATFAGIVRTPLTSVFMIFELTRNYSILVPLMLANLTSYVISYRLQRLPIYVALAEQDGIHLPESLEPDVPLERSVLSAMEVVPLTFDGQRQLADLPRDPIGGLYLVVHGEDVLGVLPESVVQRSIAEGNGHRSTRELIAEPGGGFKIDDIPHVHPDESLDLALERMGSYHVRALPVLDRSNVRKLRGFITLDNVMEAYGKHPHID
jgi:CIC family chloride channel protein